MMFVIGGPDASEKKSGGSPFGGGKKKPPSMIGGPEEDAADGGADDAEETEGLDADGQKDEALRLMGVPQEKRQQFRKALESFIYACQKE